VEGTFEQFVFVFVFRTHENRVSGRECWLPQMSKFSCCRSLNAVSTLKSCDTSRIWWNNIKIGF
jgi:hypothetical protein